MATTVKARILIGMLKVNREFDYDRDYNIILSFLYRKSDIVLTKY